MRCLIAEVDFIFHYANFLAWNSFSGGLDTANYCWCACNLISVKSLHLVSKLNLAPEVLSERTLAI